MSDGIENASLQIATTEETREENRSAEVAIDEGSEFDEEKNESEIVNINLLGYFIITRHISQSSDIIPNHISRQRNMRTKFIRKFLYDKLILTNVSLFSLLLFYIALNCSVFIDKGYILMHMYTVS